MDIIRYKVYIPFEFDLRKISKGDTLEKEFDIDGVHIQLVLNKNTKEEDCYIFASTEVDANASFDDEELAEVKIGNAVQLFFDGLSKTYNNNAFFNVFNGEEFIVRHECYLRGCVKKSPARKNYTGMKLDNEYIEQAVCHAKSNDECLKQTFFYMKEGEYLIDIGRYNGAIIQFAVMLEYFINKKLREKGFLKNDDRFKPKYLNECKKTFEAKNPNVNGKMPFSFAKYVYGLSFLGITLDEGLVQSIDEIYTLRNKLAHGYDIFEACGLLGIKFDNEAIAPKNVWTYVICIVSCINEVYELIEEHFEEKTLKEDEQLIATKK